MAKVILEPLNRYESNSLKDVQEGAEIVRRVNSKGCGLMADFFHMHIEEPNLGKSLTAVKDILVHCHLADNTRKEPDGAPGRGKPHRRVEGQKAPVCDKPGDLQ